MRGKAAGVNVLGGLLKNYSDWSEARFKLAGLQLGAEDNAHGEELRRRLQPPRPEWPRILVPRRAAA